MKEIPIFYEDSEIIVVNKPFGLAVQGGKGISHSLDDELSKLIGQKIHLVHRLDRETSGLLIVAKNAQSAAKWTNLISSRKVKKEYEAVCFGTPKNSGESGSILLPIKKNGKELPAQTDFRVVKKTRIIIEENSLELSLLRLFLKTGRMHQIRLHLAQTGAPIAADDKHGDFAKNRLARKIGIKHLQLCARRLSIPTLSGNIELECPLPNHFFDFEKYSQNTEI